jgi:hypothetical protein
MHSFLIAALFVAIVMSPCAAALWSRPDSAWKPRAVKAAKRVEEIADEIEDPWTAGVSNRRAVLLKCARTSQLRHLHVHEGGLADEAMLRSLQRPAVTRQSLT